LELGGPPNPGRAALRCLEVIAMVLTTSREQLRTYLGKVGWPVSTPLLIDQARQHEAPADILEMLGSTIVRGPASRQTHTPTYLAKR
jgi:hypothetical protein